MFQSQLSNKQQKSSVVRLVRLTLPKGICDVEVQQALRLRNPKKLKKALARSLQSEAAKQAICKYTKLIYITVEIRHLLLVRYEPKNCWNYLKY